MNVCFDVNAIIYLYTDAPQQGETLFAYDVAITRGFEAFVPACSLADIHYILHRHGLSGQKLDEALGALFQMFRVFDVNEQDGIRAWRNGMKDFEDALIAESAARNGMDAIITYNVKDFKHSPVKAMLPADFTAAFKPDDIAYADMGLGPR